MKRNTSSSKSISLSSKFLALLRFIRPRFTSFGLSGGGHSIIALEKGVSDYRKMDILEYCLDISAACVVRYPYGIRERIQQYEKEYLLKLFAEFNISPHKTTEFL
ncbi:hypothetical protein BMR04_13570 [Methylococcaceae bacterium HT3]|nr:hypothetical protein BMR04_13570 [Methylococcaceae bacterium HT3]